MKTRTNPARKLTLAKETLRQLDQDSLKRVCGASVGCGTPTAQTILCKRK